MKRIFSLILLMFLCSQVMLQAQNTLNNNFGSSASGLSMGQRDRNGNPIDTTAVIDANTIPIGLYSWKIDSRFGNVTFVPVDTLTHAFQNTNDTGGMTGQYNYLGNLGSPRLSRLFFDRRDASQFFFTDPYDLTVLRPEDIIFTNTLSPFTNLSYYKTFDSRNGEERFKSYFAINANKRFGVGFYIDYLYGRGLYASQSTAFFNGGLFASYRGDKYNMHFIFNNDNLKMAENGGIADDRYITNPLDMAEGKKEYKSYDIPTNLNKVWNHNTSYHVFMTQRYNLGFHKEKTDSVTKDSVRIIQEFVPVTSFIHTLRIRNAKHTVYSYDTPDHYYADLFYGDPNNMSDRTRGYSIQNTLGIALREGFNKWAKAGLTAFASHEYRHYTMPDLNGGNKIIRSYSENNISVGGQLSKREGKTLHYDVTGEVTLLGEDVGQFDVEGRADLNFRLFKDTVQLAARAFVKNLNPSFYMRHYHSQFAWWDNDLNKEFRTRIEGTLSLKRTRTALTVGVENIKNYAYFATDKIAYNDEGGQFAGYSNRISVKQYGGSVQVFSARLNQNFKFGILHWDNEVAYQKTSNQDILPLPDLSAYSNLYIVFRIAKVLRVQLGGDVRYFTEYYAPDYAPIIQQFTVQSPETRIKLGNYPICNAYVNLFLKHCRFYVNVNHVNNGTGNKNAFLVPHYPINPMNIHFGLSWNFFN